MGIVHRHKRVTVSGKRVTVRQHTRDTGRSTDGNERRPAAEDASPAPRPAALPPPTPRDDAEEWWAEDDRPPPGEFWDEGDAGEDGAHLHPGWAKLPQPDEVEHEGHTFKVNRAPAYRPQGDHDFAAEREWVYCDCAGSHRPGCPNGKPGGLPPLRDEPDETGHDG